MENSSAKISKGGTHVLHWYRHFEIQARLKPIIDDSGRNCYPSWSFTNDAEGFSQLKLLLNSLDTETRIGLESTGHYGMNLKLFLESQTFIHGVQSSAYQSFR